MNRFAQINHEITTWNGTFDKLTKNLTCDDYYMLAYQTNWHNESDAECADLFYQNAEWGDLLCVYLIDMLEKCISSGIRHGTDNIFRLWYEMAY